MWWLKFYELGRDNPCYEHFYQFKSEEALENYLEIALDAGDYDEIELYSLDKYGKEYLVGSYMNEKLIPYFNGKFHPDVKFRFDGIYNES